MTHLVTFELRKILKKRLTLVSVAVVFVLSALLSFAASQNMYAFDGRSTEGSGKTAIQIDKSIAAKYKGILTDEKVQQMMADFKLTHNMNGMNAKYLYQNATQSAVFAHFSDMSGNWNGLSVSDIFGNEEIRIGYVNGWLNTSQNMAKIFVVLSLVIILMTAPVFSGEYNGVDKIILTSKWGRSKCTTAKVIASLLSALFVTVLVVAFNIIWALVVYGSEGLDSSILFAAQEFVEGFIPFNITSGTLLKYQVLLVFTSAISITGITLILSSACKKQLTAFVVSVAIYMMPIMLPISEASPLFRLIVLSPLYHVQYISILSVDQMDNGMLYAIWAIPVALILIGLGALFSSRIFAKHQVL